MEKYIELLKNFKDGDKIPRWFYLVGRIQYRFVLGKGKKLCDFGREHPFIHELESMLRMDNHVVLILVLGKTPVYLWISDFSAILYEDIQWGEF